MDAEPIAANVAVNATTTTLPIDNDKPCACNQYRLKSSKSGKPPYDLFTSKLQSLTHVRSWQSLMDTWIHANPLDNCSEGNTYILVRQRLWIQPEFPLEIPTL